MYKVNSDAPIQDLGGGVKRKILAYSNNIMAVELCFEKGAVGALHSHSHEQVGYLVKGSLIYEEAGKKTTLHAGDTYYVPPNVEHGVVTLEDVILLDVFTPMREDFIK